MLVLDASVVLPACAAPEGFSVFGNETLVAPPLLWPEARSALHEAIWRREVSAEQGARTFEALQRAPVKQRDHRRLGPVAWEIADDLGWAKTYDAEYLALAALLRCRLVTLDGRLRRGADRLGFVVAPSELR